MCMRCGRYRLENSAKECLALATAEFVRGSAILSYVLRKASTGGAPPLVTSTFIQDVIRSVELPSVREQIDLLIHWIGSRQLCPSAGISLTQETDAFLGAVESADTHFIVRSAVSEGLVEDTDLEFGMGDTLFGTVRLTYRGWASFEELSRGRLSSHIAFMAMKFGDTELDAFYSDYLKSAVKDTGFQLKRLDEGQPAGLIDDRLRVEIRQARFLIADLTHHNNGAYWEAGFAEGLGKPVIYMCRSDVFNDPSSRPHFDTNHHLTVVWTPGEEGAAVQRLKDTIRATLPDEAALTDPDGV